MTYDTRTNEEIETELTVLALERIAWLLGIAAALALIIATYLYL
jgi:hypothetical protein